VRLGHRSPLPSGKFLARPPAEFDVVVGAIAFDGSAVVGLECLPPTDADVGVEVPDVEAGTSLASVGVKTSDSTAIPSSPANVLLNMADLLSCALLSAGSLKFPGVVVGGWCTIPLRA
jgi:hypothetical protein